MNTELEKIELQIAEIEAKIENDEDTYECDQQVVDLEQDLEYAFGFLDKKERSFAKNLMKRLKQLRDDLDIFDPVAERKFMFPNEEEDEYDDF
jgi:hypothetical protein